MKAILLQLRQRLLVGMACVSLGGASIFAQNSSVDGSFNQSTGASAAVQDVLLQADGQIIVAGSFDSYNGRPLRRVARLRADGTIDSSFAADLGINNSIRDAALDGSGRILIGGDFTTVAGTSRAGLARLTASGNLDAGFSAALNSGSTVHAVAVQADGKILVGGTLQTSGGERFLARLNSDGSLDTSFHFNADGPVQAILAQADGRVLVGGEFTVTHSLSRSGLARLHADGSVDASFVLSGQLAGEIHDLAADGRGNVLVAGDFNLAYPLPQRAVIRVRADGTIDAGFQAVFPANAVVNSIEVTSDGTIVIGGEFQSVNGTAIQNVAKLNADGSVQAGFNSDAAVEGEVRVVAAQSDGKVIAGGELSVSGRGAVNLSRLLSALPLPPRAPELMIPPLPQTVAAGATAVFSVAASGDTGLNYQWKRNGVALSGETSAVLILNNVTSAQAGDYSVDVSNAVGTRASASAALTVALPEKPEIRVQPVDQNVSAGAEAAFTVQATGAAPLEYQWLKDGAVLEGETDATLRIRNAQSVHAGDYSVRVSNDVGVTASGTARLTVRQSPPVIVVQPASQITVEGGTAIFAVEASGSATLAFQWKKNGAELSGKTSSALVIENAAQADAGSYSVTISNSAESTNSASANLTVGVPVPPLITVQPIPTNVTAGARAQFTVQASGSAPLSFQWRRNGVALAGETSATLEIEAAAAAHAGQYDAVVSNQAGARTSSAAQLTVTGPEKPVIVVHPLSQVAPEGASVTLSVTASGTAPLSFQWRKNGVEISGKTEAQLVLNAVAAADSGLYSVRVTNSAGAATSQEARVVVGTPPTITVQPQPQTVRAGADVQLSVQASGSAPLRYQWFKDGAALGGEAGASLRLTSVTTAQAGDYSVRVDNDLGATTSIAAKVAVQPVTPPSIVVQPIGQTNRAGATIVLNVVAEGDGPLSYQWSVNGSAIAGATNNSLVIANAQAAHSGQYQARISNSAGTTNSVEATVLIEASAQNPVIDPSFVNQAVSNVHALAVQADGKVVAAFAAGAEANDQVARLNANGSLDASFSSSAGLSGRATDIEVMADGNILVAGDFTAGPQGSRRALIQLSSNGSLRTEFSASISAGAVHALALQANGAIVIGGDFTLTNGKTAALASLNASGNLSGNLNELPGPNGPVFAVTIDGQGRLVVGGSFTAVNGSPRTAIARLQADGSVDASFSASLGGSSPTVRAVQTQADGKLVVGGEFVVGGRSNLVRLNADGSLDQSFSASAAPNDAVNAVVIESDGQIVIGGEFSAVGGTPRQGLARLNADGSVDAAFNAGLGPNSVVADLAAQADGNIVAGGNFPILELFGDPPAPSMRDARLNGAVFEVKVDTVLGRAYILESVLEVGSQNWQTAGTVAGTGGTETLRDAATLPARKFYRVKVQ